jgi:predicted metal-dependent hydrolase
MRPRTPPDVELHVRKSSFAPPPSPRRYWAGDDAVKTHFLDAVSCVLPAYEHFFIGVVGAARGALTEPRLREDARRFCAQEGQHATAHRHYNELLLARPEYARLARVEQLLFRVLHALPKRLPQRWSLALAAGGEHLTSYVTHEYLSHPERWSVGSDPAMEWLFRWHAVEEIEHKAVCFDVCVALGAGYGTRSVAYAAVAMPSVLLVLALQLALLREDGLWRSASVWRNFLGMHFGQGGLVRGLVRESFRYLRPGFHPWDLDDRHLLTALAGRD